MANRTFTAGMSVPPHRHTAAAGRRRHPDQVRIVREPRRFGAWLQAGRFPVLWRGGTGSIMQTSYHAGVTR